MIGSIRTEFLRFVLVGAVGTATHYVALFILVELMSQRVFVGAGIGAAMGATVNYLLSHFIVFPGKRSHLNAFSRFAVVATASAILNGSLVAMLVSLRVGVWTAQIAVTTTLMLLNYVLSRTWVFSPRKR